MWVACSHRMTTDNPTFQFNNGKSFVFFSDDAPTDGIEDGATITCQFEELVRTVLNTGIIITLVARF
jgi:hypothetical protein